MPKRELYKTIENLADEWCKAVDSGDMKHAERIADTMDDIGLVDSEISSVGTRLYLMKNGYKTTTREEAIESWSSVTRIRDRKLAHMAVSWFGFAIRGDKTMREQMAKTMEEAGMFWGYRASDNKPLYELYGGETTTDRTEAIQSWVDYSETLSEDRR